MVISIFHIIFIAIDTGYWRPSDLSEWCDRLLKNSEKVPWWLAELASAKSCSEVTATAANAANEQDPGRFYGSEKFELGFIVLAYLHRKFSEDDFRSALFSQTDGGEYWEPDYDFLYDLVHSHETKITKGLEDQLRSFAKLPSICMNRLGAIDKISSTEDEWITISASDYEELGDN